MKRLLFLFSATFFLFTTDSRSDELISLPESIKKKWNQDVESVKPYRTKTITKHYRVEDGRRKLTSEESTDVLLGDGFGRLSSDSVNYDNKSKKESGIVVAFNSQYAFQLGRFSLVSLETYILEKIDVNLEDGISFDQELPTRIKFNKNPGLSIHGMWLPDILQSTTCRILELEPIKDGNTSLLKLRFNYEEHTQTKQGIVVPWEGSVFLDEEKGFLIQRYQLAYSYPKFKGLDITENELTIAQDSIPFIKRRTSHYRFTPPGSRSESEELEEYVLEPKECVESDCTLTAFGLPEPSNLPRRTPWYLWVAGAGILCLGVAALFRWKARQAGIPSERRYR